MSNPKDTKKKKLTKTKNENESLQETQVEKRLNLSEIEILDQVDYTYSNHARLSANKWDIRIAFGDIGGTGKVRPLVGIVLPPLTAKGLAKALQRMVDRTEERLGEIKDPDAEGELNVDVQAE